MMRKVLLVVGAVLLVVVAGGAVFVASRQHLRFDATPYPSGNASADSAVVERGRYIVRVAAPCAACHGGPKQYKAYTEGAMCRSSAGSSSTSRPASSTLGNLTPDAETGLGNVPDSAIARALRYGVGHDGRALLPFMEMQGLSDDDLQAVVSYLRTQPAVRNPVPPHSFNLLGKVVEGRPRWRSPSSGRDAADSIAARRVRGDGALPRRIRGALLGVSHRAESDDRRPDGTTLRRKHGLHGIRRPGAHVVAAQHNE
jgi:mono/diheme cytochrome c family protein